MSLSLKKRKRPADQSRATVSLYMRLFRIIAVVGGIALFGCESSAQVKVSVSLGADGCRRVDVPGTPPWLWSFEPAIAKLTNLAFQPDIFYGPEFRAPIGRPSELYFAAIPTLGQGKDARLYSKEKYAVSLRNSRSVRRIGAQEWRSAEPLAHFREYSQPDFHNQDDDSKNVFYKGKEFFKSGEHSSLAILSADDRWIAVFSYDGKQLPPEQTHPGTIGIPGVTKSETGRALFRYPRRCNGC
jgi:hypothetical protein